MDQTEQEQAEQTARGLSEDQRQELREFWIEEDKENTTNTFPHFPQEGEVCPVCRTRKDTDTILVSIPGTEQGNIMQAKCVHKKCYDLFIEMNKGE